MPQNCCVPKCTKKIYVEDGLKISYHKFPEDRDLLKKWLIAIRRDLGRYFKVTAHTRVCSRHFKPQDYKSSLGSRKRDLLPEAVPSEFPWKQGSPYRRRSPRKRYPIKVKTKEDTLNNAAATSNDERAMCDEEVVSLPTTSEDINEVGSISDCEPTERTFPGYEELKKKNSDLCNELCSAIQAQEELRSTIEMLERQLLDLKSKIFTSDKFTKSDKDVVFYTGFSSVHIYQSVYKFLDPGEKGENIIYWHSTPDKPTQNAQEFDGEAPKQGRPRQLSTKDEYFLTLCRLRQGFREHHLSHLFNVSQTTISRIVISWINFMFLRCSVVPLWPSRSAIDLHMPADFKEKYPSTRVIIDCTEIKCQMPKSYRLNSELFSSYKNHTTLKGLVGVSPGGAFTFISQLYTGRISDKEIVQRSGFMDLPFTHGDVIMADKGFTIDDLLPVGCTVNYPPFLGSNSQMSAEEVAKTQAIASLRIHVERAINKVKNFHIWDSVIPFTFFGVVNQMWAVSCFLCNCQNSIIST